MGKYGGALDLSGGARSVSRQIASYAASGARATAARVKKQEAEKAEDARRYLAAARAGQVTVFTREPTRGTAAYESKQMILAAQKQAATERIDAMEKKVAAEKKAREEAAAVEKKSLIDKATDLIKKYGKSIALLKFPWIARLLPDIEEEAGEVSPTGIAGCPEGLFYDAPFYAACKDGYIEYSLKGHNKCVCSARLAEAKNNLDMLYSGRDEGENGEGKGITDVFGALSKGEININSIILAAAVVMLIISLIKR